MQLTHLWLENFRNYKSLDLALEPSGLILITGNNGQGKSNLLEAIGYSVSLRSFRGAGPDALVAAGQDKSFVRAQGSRDQRELLVEIEISRMGRNRTFVNKQPVRGARRQHETLLATVFSPEDLAIVKGGPAERRKYLDDLLADSDPRMAALQQDLNRILKQRNTLLRQAGGRSTAEVESTLDVWDVQLAQVGERLGDARESLLQHLREAVTSAYQSVALEDGDQAIVGMAMLSEWHRSPDGRSLLEHLHTARKADLARGATGVGPHRDDCSFTINGLPAQTHASQGEQRTLALALRLGAHQHLSERVETNPILLLDDVFSELDDERASRLLASLPKSQTFLTTATGAPPGSEPEAIITVEKGHAR